MIDIPDRQTSDIQGPSLLCGIMICLLLYVHRGCLFSPRIGCCVCVFVYVLSMGNIILCKHRARLSGGVIWMRHTVSVRSQRAVCVSPREWEKSLSVETGCNQELQPFRLHKKATVWLLQLWIFLWLLLNFSHSSEFDLGW